jgi:hypothetical protein
MIIVGLQLVGVAGFPLKVTVLLPWADPKADPVMVIIAPTGPKGTERLLI